MDTYREMQLLNDMWVRGEAPWRRHIQAGQDDVAFLA
jgi:hypothetical protein